MGNFWIVLQLHSVSNMLQSNTAHILYASSKVLYVCYVFLSNCCTSHLLAACLLGIVLMWVGLPLGLVYLMVVSDRNM